MKLMILSLIGVLLLTFGLLPNVQQQDYNPEVRKALRDVRYSEPYEKNRPISDMGEGQVRQGVTDFVDPYGYDNQKTEEAKASIRAKLSLEQAAARQKIFCDSVVIVWGTVKEHESFVTADDTSIYTVYRFWVNETYRVLPSVNLAAGKEIEVTVPGGFAKNKKGKLVGVRSSIYPYLAKSQTYVLALKYDGQSGDYYPFDPVGIYRITPKGQAVRGDAMHQFLARRSHLAGEPSTFDSVISEIKTLACSQ